MTTLQQLPEALTVSDTDTVLLNQGGVAKMAPLATVYARTQERLTLATGSLLGRRSVLPGDPEPILLGAGLVLGNGSLAVDPGVMAPLKSPNLTGLPTAPTPPSGDASNAIATTAFVKAAIPATPNVTVPIATTATLGGIKLGAGLSSAADGTVSVAVPTVTSVAGRTGAISLGASDISGLATVASSGKYTDLLNIPSIPAPYQLPTATSSSLGGVKVGPGLSIAADGTLTGLAGSVSSVAGRTGAVTITATDVGGLAVVAQSGSYNDLLNKPTIPSPFTLSAATTSVLGGVKVGANLSVAVDGTLSIAPSSLDLSTAVSKSSPGTTTRSFAARFGDTINVLDFGAKLDGSTDDLAAFTAAQLAAQSKGGALIVVPSGKPYLSGTVYTISGNGWLIYPAVTFAGPGQIVGLTDQGGTSSALTLAKFSNSSRLENGLFISHYIGATNSAQSYEKNGLYVRVVQSDPSTSTISRDAVAGEFQAYIQSGNLAGRLWAGNFIASVSSGADGYCIGNEIAIENNGTAQPLIDQPNSKNGINLLASGSNNCTASILINSDTAQWNTGIFVKDTAVSDKAVRIATAKSGQWVDVASIDRAGNAFLNSLQINGKPLAAVALSGSYNDLTNLPTTLQSFVIPASNIYTNSGTINAADNLALVNLPSAGTLVLPSGNIDGKQILIKRIGAAVTLTGTIDSQPGASISMSSPTIKESVAIIWNTALATWLAV